MNNPEKLIYNALTELKTARLAIQPILSDSSMAALGEKYSMLFMGDYASVIMSSMLRNSLKCYWGHDIDSSDFLASIPPVCSALGMKLTPLIPAENAGQSDAPVGEYLIQLF